MTYYLPRTKISINDDTTVYIINQTKRQFVQTNGSDSYETCQSIINFLCKCGIWNSDDSHCVSFDNHNPCYCDISIVLNYYDIVVYLQKLINVEEDLSFDLNESIVSDSGDASSETDNSTGSDSDDATGTDSDVTTESETVDATESDSDDATETETDDTTDSENSTDNDCVSSDDISDLETDCQNSLTINCKIVNKFITYNSDPEYDATENKIWRLLCGYILFLYVTSNSIQYLNYMANMFDY